MLRCPPFASPPAGSLSRRQLRDRNDPLPRAQAWRRECQRLLQILLLALLPGLVGCAESESRPPDIPLRAATSIERRATLSILRRAWEDRPEGTSDDHCWYERRLLIRSAFFGRKIRDTETYVEACQFWMRCVREHLEAYDDEHYRAYKGR